MENLTISENGKYLMQGDKPFFWLGDTAWLMLQKLEREETRAYLRNRAEKGFNVIQTVLLHMLPGVDEDACSLVPGIRNVQDPGYWDHVDTVLDMAEELGLYLGLLPAWGSMVSDGILDLENMERYAEFLGKRFQKRKSIVWILGGDIRGEKWKDIYRLEGEILKRYNPERLITFHPFGRTSSSLWFHEEKWLDFNMFQSGHRRYDQAFMGGWDEKLSNEIFFGEDNWRYVERDHSLAPTKPTLDGEPSYEGIVQGLHDPTAPYWEEWDVRRYAYWSVFAGSAGHTYGSNAIMQFYRESDGKGDYNVREPWQDALHHTGAGQLQHLKRLMESVDYGNGAPREDLPLYGQKERYHRIAVFAGENFVFCYDYSGDRFLLDLTEYMDRPMDAYWMDPRDGTMSYITTLKGVQKWLASPVARKDKTNDWVLVLRASNLA